jgi:hypothetical protein
MYSIAHLGALPIEDLACAQAAITMAQSLAARAGITLREAPPEPTSCCGRGCNGCVWEGYYSALAYWRDEALLLLSEADG